MDDATRLGRCRQCGADLPADRIDDLCPACLMAAAALSGSHLTGDEATTLGLASTGSDDAATGPRLAPGQTFGPYRINRLLGRGGMGEVYEAEHLEHGRRVALKVLNRRLAGSDDRARFFREGQLAASVTHPNVVYIFGSEEIAGIPVIAMELVSGGTLKDRVVAGGPLPAARAVDAVLDLLAGLDAANAAGVLHRDIKPSNCFLESDGRVKIGDFGLSISTLARDVHERDRSRPGSFEGTPQFAAPEQLKGQTLDVRADIYSVGATLYYLLTGHPPFDDRDLPTLVARVTGEPPVSPRRGNRRIPPALAAIVLRCLAKDRADRPASHAALEDLLRPFGSEAPVPATPGLRLVAGVIDRLTLLLLSAPLTIVPMLKFEPPASVNFNVSYADPSDNGASIFAKAAFCVVMVAYYTLFEGLGGASIGKRLCHLEVTARGQRPGLGRAFVRSLIFMMPTWWAYFAPSFFPEPDGPPKTGFYVLAGASVFMSIALIGVTFTSMRRRNGYAAWHDLATGTRVVNRGREQKQKSIDVDTGPEIRNGQTPIRRLGPFEVTQPLGATATGELFLGFDPILRRNVWLHVLPEGTPAVPPALRDLARPGRQRWLNGRRTDHECWDAYDAPEGVPLAVATRRRQPWRVVRQWIQDLAREIEAATHDGTLPALSLDRVWITRGSRARLVDVQAGPPTTPPSRSPQSFLSDVAAASLNAEPLPLTARTTLDALARDAVRPDQLARRIDAIAASPDQVTAWRRGVSVGLANAPMIFALLAMLALVPLASRIVQASFLLPINCLIEINKLEGQTDTASADLRTQLETYCSATYGRSYSSEIFWRDPRARQLTAPLRPLATRVLANHPSVTPEEAARAADGTRAVLDEASARSGARTGLAVAMALPSGILLVCAVIALLSSVFVRGGVLMRMLGLAVVNRHGRLVGRGHSLWRAVVAWSPAIVLGAWFGLSQLRGLEFSEIFSPAWLVALALGVAAAGAIWTIRHPSHSWQDRVTRTWVVTR